VEANTERPTDSTLLVRLIARVCTNGGNLHRLDLPDMNQIGLLEQQEELRQMSQQIHFLNGKARGAARQEGVFPITAAGCADYANVWCAIWSWFAGTWRAAPICHQVGV
jgi:hypothetical protein